MTGWLHVDRRETPLIVSIPHAGTLHGLRDDDTDWFVERLYADAPATIVRTDVSRTMIDVNRDPSGVSLYPGQATTGLCPATLFDGTPLYPDATLIDVAARQAKWFDPYHAALRAEIARLRGVHPAVVLYDAHAIRSRVPRLFDGTLPQFNIGTNSGKSCAPGLAAAVSALCGEDQVVDGRFRGGWITRHYGDPANGVHAIQMELAMRGYLDESEQPPRWDAARARPLRVRLAAILAACIDFAKGQA